MISDEKKQPERMTLREFKFWLEGLLSGNDNPHDLPKRDQWKQIMMRIELIDDPSKPFVVSTPVSTAWATIPNGGITSGGFYLGGGSHTHTVSHGTTGGLSNG